MEMYFINEEKINPVLAYAFEKNYLSQHLKFNTTGTKDAIRSETFPKIKSLICIFSNTPSPFMWRVYYSSWYSSYWLR